MGEFRDTTGRPGPSTWELGTYPDGQDDWPVSGVSWYEEAAYAAYAGKRVSARASALTEKQNSANLSHLNSMACRHC